MKKKLFLIDGYSLIYRSYWAFIKSPIFSSDGRNISAVFGFLKTLFFLIEKYNPDYLSVVLDSKVPTFRHEMYPLYKGTRDKAPDDLHEQVPLLTDILGAMSIALVRKDRYEADDLMGSLAKNFAGPDCEVFIISSDKDLMQVIDDSTHMLRYEKGLYNDIGPQEVVDRFGIQPAQVIDYLSLVGDSADNIPGVKGIGPKTAVTLLQKFNSLEGIYQHLEDCPGKTKEKLETRQEDAFLSKQLVTLALDCIGKGSLDTFLLRRDHLSGADALLSELGSKGLVSGLEKISGVKSSFTKETTEFTWKRGSYETVTDMEALHRWIQKIHDNSWFALDIETNNINAMRADPVGFSLSVGFGTGCYIPLSAGGRNYFSEDDLRPVIIRLVEDPRLKLIGHNFKYDYKVLKRWGVTVRNLAFDTMIAAWVLDTSAPAYGMDALAERCFGYKTITFHDIVDKGGIFPDVKLDTAAEYAAEDADITYRFYESFSKELKERKLEELFYTVEMPLVRILGDIEFTGIKLLPQRLIHYSEELEKELHVTEDEIFQQCGRTFNINSTKQLQEILFTVRKLKPVKKTKTGFSTDIKVLEILSKEDVVPALVLKHRSLAKLKSTYVDSLPQLINPQTERIHTHFLQTGTATGRLSSKDPNLQNIPIRSEEGRKIRKAFIAEEGKFLLSADYSQIELVILAHLSSDKGLMEAFTTGVDVHRMTGSLIFGVQPEEVTKDQRRIAKTINFGVMYGMSAFRLSRELSLPMKEASGFITSYFNRYAGIKAFIDKTVAGAEETGKVKTLLGRERMINGIRSRNKTEKSGAERIAVNTTIQGSAADIVKTAMIKIASRLEQEKAKTKMILQVHDELIFEVPEEELAFITNIVKTEMEGALSLSVPVTVSIESGKNWGELH